MQFLIRQLSDFLPLKIRGHEYSVGHFTVFAALNLNQIIRCGYYRRVLNQHPLHVDLFSMHRL